MGCCRLIVRTVAILPHILAGALLLTVSCAFAANSTISGTVQNIDGSNCVNCTITFNSFSTQVIGGITYQPLLSSTTTDFKGNLTPISLPQGLTVQITVSENGQTFAPYSAIVPFIASVTFDQMNQGITTDPLDVLASLQPPTGPLGMNNQKIVNLACGTNANDAVGFGCNATFNNLTITGGFTQNVSGLAINGRFTDSSVLDPAAPTSVIAIGATGATSYTYFVVCHDGNGGTTLASSGTTVGNGAATLNTINYNQVAWTFPAHALSCDVLRDDTAHSTIGGLGLTASPFNDQSPSTNAYTTPTRNTTADGLFAGYLSTQVSAGTGDLLFGSNNNQSLDFGITTAGVFTLTGGKLVVPSNGIASGVATTGMATGDVSASRNVNTGRLFLGSNGSQYLDFGTTNTGFTFLGGDVNVPASNKLTFQGSGSGQASISVPAAAGTPVALLLPTTSGASGNALSTDGAGNTSWINFKGGGFASGSCTTGALSTSANTTVSSLVATAPATGGPFRAMVSYYVPIANTTNVNLVECRVSDGAATMGASEVNVTATGGNSDVAPSASVFSPVTYANAAATTFTLTCKAFAATATVVSAGALQGNACGMQVSYIPSN